MITLCDLKNKSCSFWYTFFHADFQTDGQNIIYHILLFYFQYLRIFIDTLYFFSTANNANLYLRLFPKVSFTMHMSILSISKYQPFFLVDFYIMHLFLTLQFCLYLYYLLSTFLEFNLLFFFNFLE